MRDVFQNMKSFLETQNLLVYIILYAPCKHENNLGLEPHMKNLFFLGGEIFLECVKWTCGFWLF